MLGSALNPGALVVSAVYLAKERGARLETAFMTGGLIIGALVGVVVLVLIRVIGLELPTNLTPRYGIRLGLGIIALTLAAFQPRLRTRLRRPGEEGQKKPSLSTRLMEGAQVGGAIVVRVLIFAPGLQYLAGVEGITAAEPASRSPYCWSWLQPWSTCPGFGSSWPRSCAPLTGPRAT